MFGLRILWKVVLVILLTIVTQTGGLVYLACTPLFNLISRKVSKKGKRWFTQIISFLLIYLAINLVLVPPLAALGGRVPLPLIDTLVQPLTIMTFLTNRHYVTPQLHKALNEAANKISEHHPGTVVAYLDANFPFFDGFPLLPHLSHDDGKKIDLAFFYSDQSEKYLPGQAASPIGYGGCEPPLDHETNQPELCVRKNPIYSLLYIESLNRWFHQNKKLDTKRTSDFCKILARQDKTQKLFIEPHLAQRFVLEGYSKIRFQGCHSVRHDDHIHWQIE